MEKNSTSQELQYSQENPSNLQRFMLLFRVILSLNPRLAFGLKIRHLLRHKFYLFMYQLQSAGAYIISLGVAESVLCDSECVKDRAV